MSTTFRPPPLYQALFTLPVLLVALLAYDFLRSPQAEGALMLAGTVVLAFLTVPRALGRVDLADDRLILSIPLHRPQSVHLRQLIDYEATGRMWHTLLLRYHPMDERGRLDIANQEYLTLVPLQDQYILEEQLQAIVGKSKRQPAS
jgi:hypothetical protein